MTVRLTNLWPSNSRSNWNLEMLFFEERGKPELPGEKPLGARTRTNNKLNPHLSPSPGIEPGPHWWEACVGGEFSTTAPFPPLGFGGGGCNPRELDFVKPTWVGILTSTTVPGQSGKIDSNVILESG